MVMHLVLDCLMDAMAMITVTASIIYRRVRRLQPELCCRVGCGVDGPSFEPVSPTLRWIAERMFVGIGARYPDQVVMRLFLTGLSDSKSFWPVGLATPS
jgi:hypothetical protein